jgi:uncharacterized protein (TIGR02145 family)
LVENLKTTYYNDTTPIPLVTDDSAWVAMTTPGYCWYNYEEVYNNTYGGLYNWYAVNTGKLAPDGWHVPTDSEWSILTTYLGGLSVAGGKLKEAGTMHWVSPNTGATNETGFSALPGSSRDDASLVPLVGKYGYWWSSTAYNTGRSWARFLHYNNASVLRTSYLNVYGFSVRCIRN